jgi:DNA-binding response OmpR family regulator
MIDAVSDQCILVVDDDPAILSALTRGLRLEGYAVVSAEDAETALASARARRLSGQTVALIELLARLRALLRRVPTASDDRLRFEDVTMDLAAHRVWRGDRPIELRPREYELLEFFLRNPDRVLPRGLLFERVWGYEFLGDSNVIDVTVKNLRHKLDEGGESDLIHTVRRVGYALRSP